MYGYRRTGHKQLDKTMIARTGHKQLDKTMIAQTGKQGWSSTQR